MLEKPITATDMIAKLEPGVGIARDPVAFSQAVSLRRIAHALEELLALELHHDFPDRFIPGPVRPV